MTEAEARRAVALIEAWRKARANLAWQIEANGIIIQTVLKGSWQSPDMSADERRHFLDLVRESARKRLRLAEIALRQNDIEIPKE